MNTKVVSQLLDKAALDKTIARMAEDIVNRSRNIESLAVVGMRTRGVHIARRLKEKIDAAKGIDIDFATLDVTFYRDDFRIRHKQPSVQLTDIPFSIDERDLLLVDDVLFTGRTVRSALNAVMDHGRPGRIDLAVLIDRGHRELPIQPDYVGEVSETLPAEEIQVRLEEEDGEDGVFIVKAPTR